MSATAYVLSAATAAASQQAESWKSRYSQNVRDFATNLALANSATRGGAQAVADANNRMHPISCGFLLIRRHFHVFCIDI